MVSAAANGQEVMKELRCSRWLAVGSLPSNTCPEGASVQDHGTLHAMVGVVVFKAETRAFIKQPEDVFSSTYPSNFYTYPSYAETVQT